MNKNGKKFVFKKYYGVFSVVRYGSMAIIFLICLSLFSFVGCSKNSQKQDEQPPGGTRVISFSGYDWEVRSSNDGKVGPGPNYFSDSNENVWVDDEGKLHLRIIPKNGKWYAAEVTLLKSLGYGHYVFQTDNRMDILDKNVVAGFFLYRDDNKEIDIEFSRWGQDQDEYAQYVVQPGDKNGNKKRFAPDLPTAELTSLINWQSDSIGFYNYKGMVDPDTDSVENGNMIEHWIYGGSDIPSDKEDLAMKINFWLFRGMPPSTEGDMEVVISSFKYFK